MTEKEFTEKSLFERWCGKRYDEYLFELDVIADTARRTAAKFGKEQPKITPVRYSTFMKVCDKLAEDDPRCMAAKFMELKQWFYSKDPMDVLFEEYPKLAKQCKSEINLDVSTLMVKLVLLTMGAKVEEKDFADC